MDLSEFFENENKKYVKFDDFDVLFMEMFDSFENFLFKYYKIKN